MRLTEFRSFVHYKGGIFSLLGIAENSNDRTEQLAIYFSLARRKLLARPAAEFFGTVEVDGQTVRRYLPLENEG